MPKILLILLTFLLLTQCTDDPVVVEGEVSRILRTLSSDEMMGRKVYTEGIKKAENFIQAEFRNAGLSPLPGEDNLAQSFTMLEHIEDTAMVTLNGRIIDGNNVFSMSRFDSVSWKDQTNYSVYRLKSDRRRSQIDSVLSDNNNTLILVNENDREWFERAKRYYTYRSRRYRTFYSKDRNTGGSDVFLLTDEYPRNLNLEIHYGIKEYELSNVAGLIEGKRSNEIVLFSAHHDHIGVVSPVQGDSIGNGANDNATGVTAVIELAKHFARQGKPERTLYFVTFTAEEAGGWGSRYLAEHMDAEHISAMFNIEMIGKPAVEGPNTAWITGFDVTDFGQILQESTNGESYRFYPDPYPNQRLFTRSDNYQFAQRGVPAHTISTTPIDVDQNYHEVSDEFETIHISHMTNTIRAIADAAQVIISGQRTPERIDTGKLGSN